MVRPPRMGRGRVNGATRTRTRSRARTRSWGVGAPGAARTVHMNTHGPRKTIHGSARTAHEPRKNCPWNAVRWSVIDSPSCFIGRDRRYRFSIRRRDDGAATHDRSRWPDPRRCMTVAVHSSRLQFTRDGGTLVVADPDGVALLDAGGDGQRRLAVAGVHAVAAFAD